MIKVPVFLQFIKENQPTEGFLMWSMVVVLITASIRSPPLGP